ncbi:protease HtpX, partial [Candidatus Pacearchaeota archaeon]
MLNVFKTFVFLAILSVLFITTGNLIGGKIGATIALFIVLPMNLIAYFYSDKLVLATSGAIPVE